MDTKTKQIDLKIKKISCQFSQFFNPMDNRFSTIGVCVPVYADHFNAFSLLSTGLLNGTYIEFIRHSTSTKKISFQLQYCYDVQDLEKTQLVLNPYRKKIYFSFRLQYYNDAWDLKKSIGSVSSKDMQTPPFSFAPNVMKDAHSAESNENVEVLFVVTLKTYQTHERKLLFF